MNIGELIQKQRHNIVPMLHKVAKGAVAGTCVALVLWLGQKGVAALTGGGGGGDAFEWGDDVSAADTQALAHDPEVRELCRQFKKYARFDGASFATIVRNWGVVINLNTRLQRGEIAPKFSHPRLLASHISQIVEGIRTLRAVLKTHTRHEQVTAEFDETAASMQRMCNQYAFNINKIVECART